MRKSTLGVLAGVLLGCAVLAPAASAAQFAAPGVPSAKFIGDQVAIENYAFAIEGAEFHCDTVNFESAGELALPTSSVRLHPTISGCDMFGGETKVTFVTTGCDLILTAGSAGQFEVACEPGKQITFKFVTCEVAIPPQTVTSAVSYVNQATSPASLLFEVGTVGLKMNKLKDPFFCMLNKTGETNGGLAGEAVLKGFNGGTQVGIKVE